LLRTYAKLAVTMFFWGGTWVAARYAVREVMPLGVATWRFLFAAVSLFAIVVRQYRRLFPLTRRELLLVLAMGASGIFLYNLCFLFGMRYISAGRGALVVALNPVVTLLAAVYFMGERMTPTKALGSALATLGCLLVIGHGNPLALLAGEVGPGEILILGCALMWAIYTLVGRVATQTLPPLVMTAYASGFGFLILLAVALADNPAQLVPDYSPLAWSAILFLGLLGTTLGFTWFSAAVRDIGAQRASVFINLVPVAAVLQGAVLLGERLDPSVLAGGALVIAGVTLAQGLGIRQYQRATP
jgi:drug/metabolite transporter (DMT)-like permease